MICNLFTVNSAYAVNIHPNAGTTSVAFLKIGQGARASGLGEAYVGISDDLYATYWNPAGLVQLKNSELGATHTEWFQEIRYEFLGFSFPLSKKNGITQNSLAFSAMALYLNGLERRTWETERPEDPASIPEGIFGSYDIIVTASYAQRVSEVLSLGLNFKLVYEKIDVYDAYTVAFDLAGLWSLSDNLKIGWNLQNIGPKIRFLKEAYFLPINIKLGTAWRVFDKKLTLALDLNQPIDNYLQVCFGAEYLPIDLLSLRAGYKYRFITDNELGGFSGLTAGIGLKLDVYRLDYVFSPFGDYGNTHRISFSVTFK